MLLAVGLIIWLCLGALAAQLFGAFVNRGRQPWEDEDDREKIPMRNLLLAAFVLVATSAEAVPPMPPELARTTWRWVSLTTPEETLTIAEPERYTLPYTSRRATASLCVLIAIAALAASPSLSRARSASVSSP